MSRKKGCVIVRCSVCNSPKEISRFKYVRNKSNYCCREHYMMGRWGHDKPGSCICNNCGKSFKRKPSHSKNIFNFCSQSCYSSHRSKTYIGAKHPRWTNTIVYCAVCAKSKRVKPSKKSSRKNFVCSKKCLSEWRRILFSGNKSHFWKGGYKSYYGPNWKKQKELARKRDKDTCQSCGKIYCQGRKFDVHHIKPFRDFGLKRFYDANSLDNLTTLCASCHRKTESKIKMHP